MKVKHFSFIWIFMLSFVSFSQNLTYLDSLSNLGTKTSKKEFVKLIINTPYDVAVADIKKYEQLSKKAILFSTELKDSVSLAESYKSLSLALHFSSRDFEAIEATIKAISIFEKLNDKDAVGKTYLDLSWKLKNRNLKKSIDYMRKGLFILKNNNQNSIHLVAGYNNYGVLLQYKNKLDSAIYYHKKSLELAILQNDSIGIPFAQSHIAEVFLKQKKYTEAKKYLEDALFIRKKRNDIYGITDTDLYLGDLYFAKGEFKKAAAYFKKGYQLSKENNYFPLKKYATEYLYKSYDSLQDYKNSLHYFKEFTSMKDSILNTTTNNRISELEIIYQTEKKEKEINKQELKIKTRNIYLILISSFLLIVGILSFGFYKRNKFKRKQLEREIDLKDALATIKTQNKLQEQRLRISRDLHDNIGSQLTFIISSIDNLKFLSKDTSDKFKDKLSSISSFTSDTIFQLRDTIWAMNKTQISMEDLHTRTLSFIEKAKTATENTEFELNNTVNSPITFTSLVGINLFRVIQEAINNAIKYAEATKISVDFSEKESTLNIVIKDNGNGFDINTIPFGNGLGNMEKRISEIDGKIKIDSKIGKGTTILINLNS